MLTESIVEDAALAWFGELDYAVRHGQQMSPGEPAAERDSSCEVVSVSWLREERRRLNQGIAFRTLAELRDPAGAGLPKLLSGELSVAQFAVKLRQAI